MNNKAVSSVVGIILLLAITVLLSAVVGAFVLELASSEDFASAGVSLDIVYNDSNAPSDDPYIKIQAVSTGNTERIWVQGNSEDKWLIQSGECNYETEAGDYLLFPVPQEEAFTIYAEKSDGSLQVIQTKSIDSGDRTSSGSYLTGCGYGSEPRGTLYSEFMSNSSP